MPGGWKARVEPAMGEITKPVSYNAPDILDELLNLVKSDGEMEPHERNRIMAQALIEVVRRTRKIESETALGLLREHPIKTVAVALLIFILLQEFVTYINISLIIGAILRLLGVPVP